MEKQSKRKEDEGDRRTGWRVWWREGRRRLAERMTATLFANLCACVLMRMKCDEGAAREGGSVGSHRL